MQIAILYICTGKYNIFWKDFYLSCEKNFIPEIEKKYFVFTDADKIDFCDDNKNIHKIFQENLGWPDNTLMRYEIFLRVKKKIEETDYCFFFNANAFFTEKITKEEFLPEHDKYLVAAIHPGYYNIATDNLPYDRNTKSTAYIPSGYGEKYFQGAINGGISKHFVEAIITMNNNVMADKNIGIIALWHDESHWNKYINDHINFVKILPPAFLYPEGWKLPFSKKILMRNKNKYGGHYYLRDKNSKNIFYTNIKNKIKKLLHLIKKNK